MARESLKYVVNVDEVYIGIRKLSVNSYKDQVFSNHFQRVMHIMYKIVYLRSCVIRIHIYVQNVLYIHSRVYCKMASILHSKYVARVLYFYFLTILSWRSRFSNDVSSQNSQISRFLRGNN